MTAMRTMRRSLFACFAALLAQYLLAQQAPPTPHLGYAYPAGGKQGEVVDVTVGGQTLKDPTAAYITGTGIQVAVGAYARPMNQKEFTDIRDKLTEAAKDLRGPGALRVLPQPSNVAAFERLAKEAGVSDSDLKGFLEFIKSRRDTKRQPNPQLAESVALKLTIDPQAPPGVRELRVLTPAGISNPIRFVVGTLPELTRAVSDDNTTQDIGGGLPIVLNGQILPGHVDRYTFTAPQGAKLVLAAASRLMTPYLADAVPGWFQVAMTLYDPKGNQVAFADHFRFDQDPVMFYKVPASGKYTLEVRDGLYRGREDFVYRVTIGELPFVTGVFPLGGQTGSPATVTTIGWNLPTRNLTVGGSPDPGIVPISVGMGKSSSNCLPFALDPLPECLEKAPFSDPLHAQYLTLPMVVNGRIDKPGAVRVFKIKGRAGDKIVAEVVARRLGSPLDSTLQLSDIQGHVLAFNDDFDDKSAGLITHQADSYLTATLPATGAYFITLRDAEDKGGPEFGYRLRVSAPRPDFTLRVVPSSITARAGLNVPITVYAVRRDGFNGDIALQLKDAPAGCYLSGAWVPAGADKVQFTLGVPPAPTTEPLRLQMEGTATIDGKEVRHAAVPAENMMQAFAYWHLVPVDDWMVAVIGRQNRGLQISAPTAPAQLGLGRSTTVHLDGRGGAFEGRLQLSMSEDSPAGISVKSVTGDRTGLTIELTVDPAKAKAGLKGNLILDISTERTTTPAKAKQPVTRRYLLGTLPAIPFEIVK